MQRFSVAIAALLASLAAAPVVWGADGAPPGDFGEVHRQAARSVVRVRSAVPLEGAPVRMPADEATFSNTGFFISAQGQVLTSVLGLAGCSQSQIVVVCPDGRTVSARVAAFDQPSGLALLETELQSSVPFESAASAPEPGQWVVVASSGGPGPGVSLMLSPGLVGGGPESVRIQGTEWHDLVATSSTAPPGSAAAPVLDEKGRLVGVVLGALSPSRGGRLAGESYVLPLAQLDPILDRLRSGESRRLGWLGVIVGADRGAPGGVRVLEIMEGSPAAQAGLQRGDVMVEMDGQVIESPRLLMERVVAAGPGRAVQVRVERDGAMQEMSLTIGPRPLLICSGVGRPGGKVVRVRWRRTIGAVRWPGAADGSEEALFQLLDENEQLRSRVRELEEEVDRLQNQPSRN